MILGQCGKVYGLRDTVCELHDMFCELAGSVYESRDAIYQPAGPVCGLDDTISGQRGEVYAVHDAIHELRDMICNAHRDRIGRCQGLFPPELRALPRRMTSV